MVGLGRLERPTSPLSGVRSNHLSYRPRMTRRRDDGASHAIRMLRKRNEGGVGSAKWGLTGPCIQ